MTTNHYLYNLIAEGEHQQQDFKYKIVDAPKLARSVSAFANTDGGRLLIGVRDDGSIHGVRSEEEIYMMHAAAYQFCTPAPTIQFETLHVPKEPQGGPLRTIVICTVMPSEMKPVFALEAEGERKQSITDKTCIPRSVGTAREKEKPLRLNTSQRTAYIRIADENIVASPVHLAIWRQETKLRGEAYGDTPDEHQLLATLGAHSEGIALNPLVKATGIKRPLCITLLARFIRFGLTRMTRREQQWIFLPG